MLVINRRIRIPLGEIEIHAVRAGGPGGQNVNKVATAVHLRFDIAESSLPKFCKDRLSRLRDRRISREGVVVIKARRHRDQERNRQDALERLATLIRTALQQPEKRKPTRPPASAKRRRLQEKKRRGQTKALRGRVRDAD